MVTEFNSSETRKPVKPYRDLRDRVVPIFMQSGSRRMDLYDVMALLLRRTFGKSVWECKCGDWQLQISKAKHHLGADSARLFDNLVILKGEHFGRMAKFSFDYAALSAIEIEYSEKPGAWLEQAFYRTRLGIGLLSGHRIVADLDMKEPIRDLRAYLGNEPQQIEHVIGQMRNVFDRCDGETVKAFQLFYQEDGWEVPLAHSQELANMAKQLRTAWAEVY